MRLMNQFGARLVRISNGRNGEGSYRCLQKRTGFHVKLMSNILKYTSNVGS